GGAFGYGPGLGGAVFLDMPSKALGAPANHQVHGLDTLRFAAAAWVAVSHGAGLPFDAYHHPGLRLLGSAQATVFDGAAAVLVFFVISGFCIHYAFAAGRPFNAGAFLSRRLVRLAVPAIATSLLAMACGAGAWAALQSVLWSLYCELIYYAVYPLLRRGFKRFGIRPVVVVATLLSLALIAANWRSPFYADFPIWITWLVAAPAWLLGCELAERVAARRAGVQPGPAAPSLWTIWAWRLGAIVYGALVIIAVFHAPWPIGYPILLAPFAFFAAAWVDHEIAWFQNHPPAAILEWAGTWSYSLYLIHPIAISLTPIAPAHPMLSWLLRLCAILAASYVFYRLVERPAQRLARRVSRLFQKNPASVLSEQQG
ncbi:MAG: acyltransferase 3, partial [Caulobacteraceae bacterium]|nr:acyltransferase 3 [Caulobacteraceae bacterium]